MQTCYFNILWGLHDCKFLSACFENGRAGKHGIFNLWILVLQRKEGIYLLNLTELVPDNHELSELHVLEKSCVKNGPKCI